MNYFFHMLILYSVFGCACLSLNLVVGYCGYLNLAGAGFFAIGCYSYALVTVWWSPSLLFAIGFAILFALILSLGLSIPAWHYRDETFILMSLAFQVVLYNIFLNWFVADQPPGSLLNLTNGPLGISINTKPELFGFEIGTVSMMAVICVLFLCFTLYISWALISSPIGRMLKGIRDDEIIVRSAGKNTALLKSRIFALSCALMAVSGVLYASYMNYVDPQLASLDESIVLLCMILVGGSGTLLGPLIGVIILISLPEVLRLIDFPTAKAGNFRLIVYGCLLVLFMHFRPQGIAGDYDLKRNSVGPA